MPNTITAQNILDFWFTKHSYQEWFQKNPEFDQKIRDNFQNIHNQAIIGELYQWRISATGRLAEIIILDQFSRNMFRDQTEAFAYDPLALVLAQEAVAHGYDRDLNPQQKQFLYMPYMHSESLTIHNEAVKLFKSLNLPEALDYEYKHQEIIKQFGRYPHRNKTLGRKSTQAEAKFLTTPNSSF